MTLILITSAPGAVRALASVNYAKPMTKVASHRVVVRRPAALGFDVARQRPRRPTRITRQLIHKLWPVPLSSVALRCQMRALTGALGVTLDSNYCLTDCSTNCAARSDNRSPYRVLSWTCAGWVAADCETNCRTDDENRSRCFCCFIRCHLLSFFKPVTSKKPNRVEIDRPQEPTFRYAMRISCQT